MHGTRACYVMGCRRPECSRANADYQRDRLSALPSEYAIGDLALHLLDVARRYAQHGTRQRYRKGCSCVDCRRANTQKELRRRARLHHRP